MIVVIEQQGERAVFANVTHIEEKTKPSVFEGTRSAINLYSGETILMGGDDIDLTNTILTVLPNAEKVPT